MLFKEVGKYGGKFIPPLVLLLIFSGCSLLDFGTKLNTTPLDIPLNAAFILSPSSGYIFVIDTEGDSLVGSEEVARRNNIKFEDAYDFLIHNGLIYIPIYNKENSNEGSNVLRILNPASGEIEESRVGWAPNNIFSIGNNLAFISTNLMYFQNAYCYNYVYDLNTKKVIDTIKFKRSLVDFAISNGDTVIMDVKSFGGNNELSEYFVLYSKKTKSIIDSGIPSYNIYAYPHCVIKDGANLYVGGTNRIAVFSLSDLSLKKNIYLEKIGKYGSILSGFAVAHHKLYVSYLMDFSSNGKTRIDIIDLNTYKCIKSIDILKNGAQAIDYSQSADKIFVPAYEGGNIYVINPLSDSIVDTIKTDKDITFTVIHEKDSNTY